MLKELTKDGYLLVEDVTDVNTSFIIGPENGALIQESGFYVVWGPKTTAGVVVIETAHERTYTGRWALKHTFRWSGPERVDYVGWPGAHLAIRLRVSEQIKGGTVNLYGVATT